ncbi:MAG: trypsin-like peptidase domain-containing protein [Bacilli bacterium]
MKKIIGILLLLVVGVTLSGCTNLITNEIYNKVYDVDSISITDFEELIEAAIEKVDQSVLGVSNYKQTIFGLEGKSVGSGFVYRTEIVLDSGEVIDYEGNLERDDIKHFKYHMITNRHVVEGEGYVPILKVYFGLEDREVNADLIQYDDKVDLAVITFTHTTFVAPVEFADSDSLKKGNFAIALGSPSGYEYYGSSTFGIISHPKRYLGDDTDDDGVLDWYDEYIQHDVAINPGNSGGPLINVKGEVIGINTMKLVSEDIDNMGFSIPSNLAVKIVEVLETGAKPKRTLLGVTVNNLFYATDEEKTQLGIPLDIKKGFFVDSVDNNSLASRSGILEDDIIISFHGRELQYNHELKTEINKVFVGSGEIVEIVIYRDGNYITLNVTF